MSKILQEPVPPADDQPAALDVTGSHKVAEYKHTKPLTCCRIDPTGRYVFAGAEDLNVYRWNLETGRMMILAGHNSWVRSMDFSPDGQTLYTAGWDGELHWWLTDDPVPRSLRMVRAHRGFTRWVRVSPDGTLLATCGNDNMIRLWSVAAGELVAEMAGHDRNPYAVDFHPDGKHLVSEDLMGNVMIWDLETFEHLETIPTVMTGYDTKFAADMGGARDMRFAPDGSLVVCAGITNVVNSFAGQQDPIFAVVDWKTRQVLRHLRPADNSAGIAWGVRFHPAGFIVGGVAKQSGGGLICFWKQEEAVTPVKLDKKERKDPAALKRQADKDPLAVKPFHTVDVNSYVRGLALTPDARRLAVPCFDGSLRIYEMTAKPEEVKAEATSAEKSEG